VFTQLGGGRLAHGLIHHTILEHFSYCLPVLNQCYLKGSAHRHALICAIGRSPESIEFLPALGFSTEKVQFEREMRKLSNEIQRQEFASEHQFTASARQFAEFIESERQCIQCSPELRKTNGPFFARQHQS
jgi:hypothetical protein